MGESDRRIGGVDGLAAGTARAKSVDLHVVEIELHFDFLRFGQNRNTGSRRVDPALRFSLGDPLHSVHPRFEFEAGKGAFALDGHRDFFEAPSLGF